MSKVNVQEQSSLEKEKICVVEWKNVVRNLISRQ